jgi:Kef-type K+ transport system membrane component KefB
MSMATKVIPELDRAGLRQFALTTGCVFALLFGLFLPWLFDHSYPLWPWGVFAALSLWGLIAAESLRPVYRAWMRLGIMISRFTTPLVLGIVFFLVIMPVGLIRRLAGKDSLNRDLDTSAKTYRVPSDESPGGNLENPY